MGRKGVGGVKLTNGGVRLLPLSVIPHFSHVKGGRVEGLGRELGFCRGAVVSGDHGINSWSTQKHGDDRCGPDSPVLPFRLSSGSTDLYFFYALEKPAREGSSHWLPEKAGNPKFHSQKGCGGVSRGVRIPEGSGRGCIYAEFAISRLCTNTGWVFSSDLHYMNKVEVFVYSRDLKYLGVGTNRGCVGASSRSPPDRWRAGPVRGPGACGGTGRVTYQLTA